jgi:hypothetical protein
MTILLPQGGKQRCGWLAFWLASALIVAACGGGGGTSRIISSTLTPEPEAVAVPETPAGPTVTLAGTARAVANTLYAYQATVAGGVGLAFSWVWGDGSFSAAGNPVQQVWNRPGSYSGVVNATVGSAAATRPFNVVVVSEPISSGVLNGCALKPDGSAACWGDNQYGQLGDGTLTTSATPVTVPGLTGLLALSAGGGHTCALKADRTVMCWGENVKGGLGDGTTVNKSSPTAVTGLTGAVALSGGTLHTCALKADGTVACWGVNDFGQLGDGTLNDALTPVAVKGLTNVVAISAGKQHTCALRSSGTASCWGANINGQLGNGNVNTVNPPAPCAGDGLDERRGH